MLRLGLCCAFRDEPIKFRITTAKAMQALPAAERLARLSALCLANADALADALAWCSTHGVGCFRVMSQILPLKTHPTVGYRVENLPDAENIIHRFRACGRFAKRHNLRTCFHPDQFVVLNSPRPEVVDASLAELEYQAEVAEWIGADVINVHGGGGYGNKLQALGRFAVNLERLSPRARSRLTIENDDKVFTPRELFPLCEATGIPLVYDVHHHRCLPDGLSVKRATEQALATWDREPLFHLSSPLEGWTGPQPQRHHDFINPADFPRAWKGLAITVEVEAKAKEVAVLQLKSSINTARVARA